MAKPFQFSVPYSRGKRDVPFNKADEINMSEEESGELLIKGAKANSKDEWRVSKALEMLDYSYSYQVPIFGGNRIRGGQVVDFLVYTPVKSTVVDVLGLYWHTGINDDKLSILRVIRKKKWKLVQITDEHTKTIEDAASYLRQHL